MSDSHVPTDFVPLTPYLHLRDAPGFIAFLEEALGAEVRMDHRGDDGNVIHAELMVNGVVIEVSEAGPDSTPTRSSFHVFVPDPDAAHARALAAGAVETWPMRDQDYGERSGGVKDRWDNQWYFARVTDMKKRTDG